MCGLIERLYLSKPNNLVYWDTLTKVKTRTYYERVMKRNYLPRSCIVAYVDVNGLKRVNDTYGHNKGSTLLRSTARKIGELAGVHDVCRIGGDEFIAIFFNQKDAEALNTIPHISYGTYRKEQYEDMSSAIIKADRIMYAQKKAYYAKQSA